MDIAALRESRNRMPVGATFTLSAPDGPVPFAALHAIGLPVIAGERPPTDPWARVDALTLRAAAVGDRAYQPARIAQVARDTHLRAALALACSHLEGDPECAMAWADAAGFAAGLGAKGQAMEFARMSLHYDPMQAKAREVVRATTGAEALDDAPARVRLEAWVRAHHDLLVGPVLDVGTSRKQRTWIDAQALRYTLDTCERVWDDHRDRPDIVADLEDLSSIPDDTFGSVVCTEVLEHVAHPDRALSELRRVTRPGGKLVLSVPWIYPFHPCPLDLRRFTAQGLAIALGEAGWTDVKVTGLPMPKAAWRLIVQAIELTAGRCPNPESLSMSNHLAVATA